MWGCRRLLAAATWRRAAGLSANGGGGASQLRRRQWPRRLLLPPAWQTGGDGAVSVSVSSLGYLNPNVCYFCTAGNHSVSYQELKKLLRSKTVFLIDVREKWEIGQYGKIPGSVNIPLGEIMEALQMDPVHFKETYNQDMPSKSDHVVFSCMAGVRSTQALAVAKSLGFRKFEVINVISKYSAFEPSHLKFGKLVKSLPTS